MKQQHIIYNLIKQIYKITVLAGSNFVEQYSLNEYNFFLLMNLF